MTLPIHRAAKLYPDNLAFVDGDVQITYRELDKRIKEFSANRLSGLQPGEHIAWCPGNDLESMVTFWAIQNSGLVACPISFRFSEEQRKETLQAIDAKWLSDLISSTNDPTNKDSDQVGPAQRVFHQELTKADEKPATIILSSGSTGRPKAIVHSMAAHVASAEGAATNMPLSQHDCWLWSLPLFHVSGLSILIRCALAGATVVGLREDEKLTSKILSDRKISHLSVVGTQLRRLMEETDFPSKYLKWVLLGGSSVDPKLVQTARSRGVRVLTTYGLSETASQVSTSSSNDDPASSGKVLPGREVKIDASGQILVRGETLCMGYYQNGLIAPVVNKEGWFETRDLGKFDENGQLFVGGRIDNMFISGGENIYPESIERVILKRFDVQQAVVVPKPDLEFGERPVVFIEGQLPDDWEAILRNQLQGFEIPIECYEMPSEFKGAIKVSRIRLRELILNSQD